MTRKCDYWNLIVLWNIVMQVQYLNIHSCLHTPLQSNLESLPCLHIYKSIIFSLFQLLDCSHAGASLWIMLRRTNRSRYFLKSGTHFIALWRLLSYTVANTPTPVVKQCWGRNADINTCTYTNTHTRRHTHACTSTHVRLAFFSCYLSNPPTGYLIGPRLQKTFATQLGWTWNNPYAVNPWLFLVLTP